MNLQANRNPGLTRPLAQHGYTALKAAAILALLLTAFLPAKYSSSPYGYLPGLLMLSLMLLSLIYFFLIKRSLRFETETTEEVCRRGETVNTVLRIGNRSVLICPKGKAYLAAMDFFGRETIASVTTFSMNGKSETEIPFHLEMDHLGVYTFGLKLLRIYDPLGIFSIAVREGKSFRVTVLPKLHPMEEIRLEERLLTEIRNISRSAVSDGFDYTGVREYALGDPMKRIHWKLSAHSSSYMTRIAESSRKNDLTVVIDFVPEQLDRSLLPYVFDCLAETALSLVEQAKNKDVEYSMLFIGRDREINRVMLKGPQDYESLIQMLPAFDMGFDTEFPDGAEILDTESHLGNRSSNIILCTSRITEELIRKLIDIRRQQRNPELYYIIPSGLNGAEAGKAPALLGALDESGIRYHFVTAEDALRRQGDF